MSSDFIRDDVRDFIIRHVDSIAQLEALLLLRAHPGVRWDVATISKRLYISEADALVILSRLCVDGLIADASGTYQYRCDDENTRLTIEHLAHTYSRHLIPVTNMIHSKSSRIREFSEAFKFKRDT